MNLIVLLLLLLLLLPIPVAALEFDYEVVDHRPVFPLRLDITMTGSIDSGDGVRLAAILNGNVTPNMRDVMVRLDSPGGSLSEGLEIARLLSSLSQIVSAEVASDEGTPATCASACVLAYLGADLRYLPETARIGVHQFRDPSGAIPADAAMDIAQRLSSQIVGLLQRQRIDTALFDRMAATTSDGIDWVPREDLTAWRVVTGPIFDERMEYRNVKGKAALHTIQEGVYGTHQMTLYCDAGLIGFAVLDEPEFAAIGPITFVVDGFDYPLQTFELLNRDDGRTRLVFRVPGAAATELPSAGTVGMRVFLPSGEMFWGFEQTVRDAKVREIAVSCPVSPAGPEMTEFPGTDISENDLTSDGFRGVSFSECKQICLTSRGCEAVSYVMASRWCWPKAGADNRSLADGIISAVRNRQGPRP